MLRPCNVAQLQNKHVKVLPIRSKQDLARQPNLPPIVSRIHLDSQWALILVSCLLVFFAIFGSDLPIFLYVLQFEHAVFWGPGSRVVSHVPCSHVCQHMGIWNLCRSVFKRKDSELDLMLGWVSLFTVGFFVCSVGTSSRGVGFPCCGVGFPFVGLSFLYLWCGFFLWGGVFYSWGRFSSGVVFQFAG